MLRIVFRSVTSWISQMSIPIVNLVTLCNRRDVKLPLCKWKFNRNIKLKLAKWTRHSWELLVPYPHQVQRSMNWQRKHSVWFAAAQLVVFMPAHKDVAAIFLYICSNFSVYFQKLRNFFYIFRFSGGKFFPYILHSPWHTFAITNTALERIIFVVTNLTAGAPHDELILAKTQKLERKIITYTVCSWGWWCVLVVSVM